MAIKESIHNTRYYITVMISNVRLPLRSWNRDDESGEIKNVYSAHSPADAVHFLTRAKAEVIERDIRASKYVENFCLIRPLDIVYLWET